MHTDGPSGQTFKDHPPENLRVRLLERLMADEIYRRQKNNLINADCHPCLKIEKVVILNR